MNRASPARSCAEFELISKQMWRAARAAWKTIHRFTVIKINRDRSTDPVMAMICQETLSKSQWDELKLVGWDEGLSQFRIAMSKMTRITHLGLLESFDNQRPEVVGRGDKNYPGIVCKYTIFRF